MAVQAHMEILPREALSFRRRHISMYSETPLLKNLPISSYNFSIKFDEKGWLFNNKLLLF